MRRRAFGQPSEGGAYSADEIMALKIEWDGSECNGWRFDGKELKPKFGSSPGNTWVWNGTELRPKAADGADAAWVFVGGELRPKVGATAENTWIIRGDRAMLKTGRGKTYECKDVPVPVIAGRVALGLF